MGKVLQNWNTRAFWGKVSLAAENIFLVLFVVYLLYLYSFNSTYYFFHTLAYARALLFLMATIGGIKTGAAMLSKGEWNRKLLPALLLSLLYIGAYYTTKSIFLLFLPVLTVTFIDTNYHKVVKIAAVMGLGFLAASYVGAFAGIIDNFINYRYGYLRSSWGFSYPTDMASFLLFIIGMAWIAWKTLPDEFVLLFGLFSLWISYAFAASRTSVACNGFFLFLVVCHMVETRTIMAFQPEHPFRRLSITLQKLATYTYPVMALLFCICLLLYTKQLPIGIWLNSMLSDRLENTSRILHDTGMHFFGTYFHQVGNGGSMIRPESNYFLDCSYMLIMIQYGWPLLFALGILWCHMSNRARIAGDLRLLLLMTMIAVHAFSEHHFTEVMYNTLLPLLFSSIPPLAISSECEDNIQLSDKSISAYIQREPTLLDYWHLHKMKLLAVGITALILFLIAPLQLNRIRTILDVSGYTGYRTEKYQFLAQLFILFLLIFILSSAVAGTFSYLRLDKKKVAVQTAIICICTASLFGIYTKETHTILVGEEEFASVIREDHEAVELIIQNADGNICVEPVPELYKHVFDGISRPILHGDDLARMSCGTVIVNLGTDRQHFSDMGFSFTQISSHHAVYSNDPAVIASLAKAGYTWSDYYSVPIEISMVSMAEKNNNVVTPDGSIVLSGSKNSLQNGPGLDIYPGDYILISELNIPPADTAKPDDTICTIQITDFYDGNLLQDSKILRNCFDQDGHLTSCVQFHTSENGSRNTEFHFIPADGQQVEILSIQLQRVSSH